MIDGMLANCCWIWLIIRVMAMDIHDGLLLVHLHLLVLLNWLSLEIC
jgi:hypothetical protein